MTTTIILLWIAFCLVALLAGTGLAVILNAIIEAFNGGKL